MSAETNPIDNRVEKQYTQEELKQIRINTTNFYKQELPLLRLEAEFEKLQADIEEHKYRRILSMQKAASVHIQAAQAQQEAQEKWAKQKEAMKADLSTKQTEQVETPKTETHDNV